MFIIYFRHLKAYYQYIGVGITDRKLAKEFKTREDAETKYKNIGSWLDPEIMET